MKPSCDSLRERLADLHDGLCTADEEKRLNAHLAECPSCRDAAKDLAHLLDTLDALPAGEPSPRLREQFEQMLAKERENAPQARGHKGGKRRFFPSSPWGQLAAAACLLLVGAAGGVLLSRPAQEAGQGPAESDTQQQLAVLRSQVEAMNSLLAQSLSQEQPDHVRLQRVASLDKAEANTTELASLLGSLALDSSTNVRLSALEALYAHARQPVVREGVIAALSRERSPLVQLAMVDFLGSLGDASARRAVEALGKNPNSTENVRRAAREALAGVPL